MFEQLTQLVNQFGQDAVVNNSAVPNEHNDAVMDHASTSIIDSIKNIASQEGGLSQLTGALQNGSLDMSNPAVQQITNQLSGSLGEKFGLSSDAASGVAGSLLPGVLGSLLNNSGASGGLMDMVSKYGGQFGLDQNNDGKVDMSDAMAAVSNKGGGLFGGLLGKIFGK
ncbi:DUF937 domain-containing protein [Flavobacterium sp. SUN052]|uniref:DUF937 domain-containing protein n=1 Tax=Flavobacterium sp. SUN052 TaxID=3002441 RepID=UPI00237D9062|nr:DUF937 domain-containing protein [Flavobacterium sp. SUN052]MEC4003853.1 DUF937 domain-containing protein [Flavobacterium sp. SUN052]